MTARVDMQTAKVRKDGDVSSAIGGFVILDLSRGEESGRTGWVELTPELLFHIEHFLMIHHRIHLVQFCDVLTGVVVARWTWQPEEQG